MEPLTIASIASIGALLIIVMYFINKANVLSVSNIDAIRQLSLAEHQVVKIDKELQSNNIQLTDLKIEIATLENDYKHLSIRFEDQQNDSIRGQEKFELLASKIIDVKTKKFDADHSKSIKDMLGPLKDRIKTFEDRIELNARQDIERHTSLREQIKSLAHINEKMTLETTNLTKALKGDNKLQGNWGEIILESILQKSGLEKGREYFTQESHTNSDGKRLVPDMVIKTPDDKVYIIDSKVTLVAYEKYVNTDNETNAALHLKAHSLSVRTHINGLASKKYHEIYQIESPDFVLMFIPIETAFAAAIKYDQSLYQYAFDRNIVIVTPSTLLATLKTIETIWRNDKQQKHALDIAIEAGKMYDKFQLFTEDMKKIGSRIDQVKNSYDDAVNKLSTGKGNLIKRAETIKSLGAKASKIVDKKLTTH